MSTNAEGFVKPRMEQPDSISPRAMQISVLYTSPRPTQAALRRAEALAANLGADVVLLWPRVVPYPLDLFTPAGMGLDQERLGNVVAGSPVGTKALLCLCRDEWEALSVVLPANSLVVIGSTNRWWPTREQRLARRLRSAGHDVVLVDEA